jgi:hypothetical protein
MKANQFKINWLKKGSKTALSILAGINRPIIPTQVTKLADSINKMGIIRPVVVAEISFITGKLLKYIVDGQHLFNACLRNGIDIPYVTIEVKDKKDLVEKIALLNASSKTWTMQDYVTAWGSLKPDYLKLNQYFEVYDFEISDLAAVFMNNTCSSGSVIRTMKSGDFKIVDEEKNVKILNYVTDMLKVIPRMNRYENRYAVREYIKFLRSVNKYNHSKFLLKLQRNKKRFLTATQAEGKLMDMFKQININ